MHDKTLIIYFSKGGASEQYTHIIAETLRTYGHVVDIVNLKREMISDLEEYDNIVVGTGVRIGKVYRRARKVLRRKDFKGKRLAIFLSSGIAVESPEKSKEKFLKSLVEKYGLDPIMYDAFPGKTPGSGGKLQDGTDPEIAKRWAQRLAERCVSFVLRETRGLSFYPTF